MTQKFSTFSIEFLPLLILPYYITGLKQLRVIGSGIDGSRDRVLVSRGHRDKRVGSLLIQFDIEGILRIQKSLVSYKYGLKKDY